MKRFNNRSILYLHGYGSSSQGEKAQLLRKECPQNRLLIPDLPLNPQECMRLSEDLLRMASNDTIIIGASLGGFYALYLAAKFKKDCLLINPVLHPSAEAKKLLSLEENQEKKKLILNAANVYLTFESTLRSLKVPKNCFVALGERDQTIDPKSASEYFEHAHIQFYSDDHEMLASFTSVLNDFEEFLDDKF